VQLGVSFEIYKLRVNEGKKWVYEQKETRVISKAKQIVKTSLEDVVADQLSDLDLNLEMYMAEGTEGSNWKLRRIPNIFIKIHKVKPARGASYIPTPPRLNNPKSGLMNIRNDDQECFKWCMKYHQTQKKKHDDRISVLSKVDDKFNYDGVNFPADFEDIRHFERQNQVAIFVYYLAEDGKVLKEKDGNPDFKNKMIFLLRLEDGEKSHYVYIKDISRVLHLCKRSRDTDKRYCPYCNQKYHHAKFDEHLKHCFNTNFEDRIANLPPKGSVMKFKNHRNKLERPYIIYADCEASLVKTRRRNCLHKHVVNSCCYYFVCTYDSSRNRMRTFVGNDCVYEMMKELNILAKECVEAMKANQEMRMSKEDTANFNAAKHCHICHECFDDGEKKKTKVRDHDHRTGKYRGAAHACCNINYFSNRYVPVVFHNLRGYDSHLIIKEAWRLLKGKNIEVIPNSTEKFMSFKIGHLRFIDSFQFMGSSLEKLVENLHGDKPENKYDNFHAMKRQYPNHYELLCQKGHYPYEWVDGEAKLSHEGLPPMEAFYSKLSKKGIDAKHYRHAQEVYDALGCEKFLDYHLAYLRSDVLLLADVFENFRRTCLASYGLDPANYLTAPSLAWDAMLLKTGVELEQISDYKIFKMVEEQKRGGLCFVGAQRYAKFNNRYLDDFDPKQPESYGMYWDMNNLYGCAMIDFLPTGGHHFVEHFNINEILQTPDDSPQGYLIRLDLIFPEETHELLKQFPPAPENIAPKEEWLTPFQKQLAEKNGIKTKTKQQKLIPHLFPHKSYVIDYRNLKYLVSLGVEVKQEHVIDVVRYDQSRWLKPYIDLNTEMRKKAKNEFEKDFYKLMNNSVFGKTMENVRNRMQLHLTADDNNAEKWFSKANFKNCTEAFGLYMIELYKEKVCLDKPIYVGTTILDLSKLLMMRFHYDVIERHFKNRYELLYSDTDSLVYQIFTADIYDWIKENKSLFDLSESDRPDMADNENKKKLGMMKDELKTLIMKEFISLNPKVYSFTFKDDDEVMEIPSRNIKKLKGVPKATVKHDIQHEDYRTVMEEGEALSRKVISIRSLKHQLYTTETEKLCLSSWYDKMQMLSPMACVPFGYMQNELISNA
jgi:hypothetical protein